MLMNGERDDPSRLPLGHREVAVLVAQPTARGLQVERNGIVDLRLDAPAHEVGEEPIAIVRLEHVQVEDVPLPGIAGGNPHAPREVGETAVEGAGVADAGGRNRLDVLDQVIAHDGLQRVEPAVVAEDLDFVAVPEPVVAQEAELAVEGIRARHDDAAVAPHVEVLEGVQAEARGHAEGAHEAVPDRGADGLAGILHHWQSAPLRHLEDRRHLGGLPRVVDGQDRPGAGRDRRLHGRGVEVEVVAHVHEGRSGPRCGDGARRGDERVGGRDHLVARSHPQGLEGKEEGVRPRAHADRVARAAELREAFLELRDGGAESKIRRFEEPLDVAQDRFRIGELLAQVRVGHAHATAGSPA